MKKFWILILPAVLFGLQTITGFPKVLEWLHINDGKSLTIIFCTLFALFALNHYFTLVRPFTRFIRFEDTKSELIEKQAKQLIKKAKKAGIDIRINIMVTQRKFLSFIEPGKIFPRRPRVFYNHLVISWSSRNMDHSPDKAMSLTVNQGVAGMTYKEGKAKCATIDPKDKNRYNLNKRQYQWTSELRVIYCFPIRSFKKKGLRLGNRIVGIVNVDTSNANTTDDLLLRLVVDDVQTLSETCSLIY